MSPNSTETDTFSISEIFINLVAVCLLCPLCLIVQALLWSIFVINLIFGYIQIPEWNWNVLSMRQDAKRVESLLRKTNNQVCVQYIFSSFDESLDFANKYLIAAYLQKERGEFERIIADWFARGKVLKEAFFNDLQLNINNSDIEIEFQKYELWKAKTRLRATPTVLVNGYHLPNNYKIEDLVYFTGLEIDVNQSLSR